VALLANTVSISALAAEDIAISSETVLPDMDATSDGTTDELSQNPDNIPAGDVVDVQSRTSGDNSVSDNDSQNAQNSTITNSDPQNVQNNAITNSDPQNVQNNVIPDTSSQGGLNNTVPANGLQNGMPSVSMSDPLLLPNMAANASGETLSLGMAWPSGYNPTSRTLTLSEGKMSFTITPTLSGTTVNTPILKIEIPSFMRFTDFPKSDPCLASQNPYTLSGTVLTYRLNPDAGGCNFSIEAEIPNGYKLKEEPTGTIQVSYYDDSTRIQSQSATFSTRLPTGTAIISDGPQYKQTLQGNKTTYNIGQYGWSLGITEHAPFSWVKMIVPLPEGAIPCLGSTPLKDGEKHGATSSPFFMSFSITYYSKYDGQENVLVYTVYDDKILNYDSRYGNINLEPNSDYLWLRFTNPTATTYRSHVTPKVVCMMNGKEHVLRNYGTSPKYITSVIFENPPEWFEVRPNDDNRKWSDVLYLKDNDSDGSPAYYYTRDYIREIYATPNVHTSYDSLKMTVPLPEGAEPGFGTGDSFEPLIAGTSYNNGRFDVTYYKDQKYAKDYDAADTLVYEIHSGDDFLISGSYEFFFEGDKTLHLRFTDPEAGKTYESEASPRIDVTRGDTTTTFYPHNPGGYLTSVTAVAPSAEWKLQSDYLHNINNPRYGWRDTIELQLDQTTYYTNPYNRSIFPSSPYSLPQYPYDWIRMTVLLPDEATPGLGTETSFKPLEDGKTYPSPSSSSDEWRVTYQENYAYANEDNTVSGNSPALIYELDPSYSTADILKGLSPISYTFGRSYSANQIHLRFENPDAVTYHNAASPKIECQIAGKTYVAEDFSATAFETGYDTSVTFVEPVNDWTKVWGYGVTNDTSYKLNSDAVLPETYQNDKEYQGFITNNTGYTLSDVTVLYSFDDGLNVDKLTLNLGDSGFPSNAEVVYTTRMDQTEKTVSLNASGSHTLTPQEDGDVFLTARITYDTVESSGKLLTASLHNYEGKEESESRLITAQIKAASSILGSSSKDDEATFKTSTLSFKLRNIFNYLNISCNIKPSYLRKEEDGTPFTITVNTTSDSSGSQYKNLNLYLRMPKGYTFTGYEPPAGWADGEYTVTNRTLTDGDILYCVAYTDDKPYSSGSHTFSFQMELEADNTVSPVMLPKEIYASVKEGFLFQFKQMSPESDIGLDINGDGDTEDFFYKTTGTNIRISQSTRIDFGGYLLGGEQDEPSRNKEYSLRSNGVYRFLFYNYVGSGKSASDGIIHISLPKAGDTLTYNGKDYTAKCDVLLTGPVRIQDSFTEDGFMDGCSIQYSTDNINWLTEKEVSDYTLISHIRIETAKDHTLKTTESAGLELPFFIDSPANGTVDSMDSCNTYIGAEMNYLLDNENLPAYSFSTLTIKPVSFSGTIYQDKNYNGKKDADESSTDRAYTLKLYSGEGTNGTPLQEITTNPADGSYGFGILLPGTYTLHVEKDADEFYGVSDYFDGNGSYTFTLGVDTPSPATNGIDMGILTNGILVKPEYSVYPESPNGKNDWYVTLPQITLLPILSSPYIDTMFWHDNETEQRLTVENRPSVKETGVYAFEAYNRAVTADGTVTARSDNATLDLKVDVDPPTIRRDISYTEVSRSNWDKIGNYLTLGNYFKEALRVKITAEDVGSGVDLLYFTLPGEDEQTAKPDDKGEFYIDIPMDITGRIILYAEDKAGNRSTKISLMKEDGAQLWVIDDQGPIWEDFVLTDINGNTGVRGADGGLWFAESVNASAWVRDEDSGLALINSRINDGAVRTQEFTGDEKLTAMEFTAAVETEGVISLWAEAADNASNVSETQTAFGIDRTAPVITLEGKTLADDGIPTAAVLVTDTGSGVDPCQIHVLWQGKEMEYQITSVEGGYRLTFPITELNYTDMGDSFLVTARDYTGWSAELSLTRYQRNIIYVAADTGSNETGDGSRQYPFRTLETALEHVAPGGRIVLLEDYNGTARVDLEVTLDLNGKVLQSDVPGSALTVGSSGILTIADSNGSASMADGFDRDPESEGEIFGGIPGDPAFTLENGVLCLADGTIYCGYTGNGSVDVQDEARMMYLLTYLNGGGTGEAPELHYIEENTTDALKPNTFVNEGYSFRGWLYEDQLYEPGDEIRMPGRNMETVAMWEKSILDPETASGDGEPNLVSERGRLDPVPKTGTGEAGQRTATQAERTEFYIEIRKREDEQSADG